MSQDTKKQSTEECGLKSPRLLWRVAATLVLLLLSGVSTRVISVLQGPIQAPIAVQQIEDDAAAYAVGHAAAAIDISGIIEFLSFGIIAVLWISFAWLYFHHRQGTCREQKPSI